MDQSAFRALLHRYQEGECTPAENRRIEQWYSSLGSERQLELTAEEQAELVATVWQRITTQTRTPIPPPGHAPTPTPEIKALTWPSVALRWAALVVLVLSAALWAFRHNKAESAKLNDAAPVAAPVASNWRVYANTSAYETRVDLPDGSAVTLAPASSLKYPRTFRGARRTVFLTGAAFFDVFHDATHPFSVYTDQVVTTVLGTSFRVQAFAGQPEVQVQVRTGKVRVSPRNPAALAAAPELIVLPNQQAVYSAVHQQLRRELVAQPALLAPQSFVFNDRPVAEVLAALQKAYGIDILYDAAALQNCTLNLSLGAESLFAKLDLICETLGASYEKADGRILFHSQPCPAE